MKLRLKNGLLGVGVILLVAILVSADYVTDFFAYLADDYSTALRELKPSAEQGDAGAQYWLGAMYAHGQGAPQDDAEAVKWTRLAAEQGHAPAQFNLGLMYVGGQGVPQDDTEAAKWTRLAAGQGYAGAQFNLGLMYAKGQGVPQDTVLAYHWFNLAAAQGDEEARELKTLVQTEMTAAEIAKAQKLSREFKPKAE